MKFKKHQITCGAVFVLIGFQLCSSTLLAGSLFYLLVGSYITREVFPNVITTTFKALASPQQSATNFTNQPDIDPLTAMVQIGKVLGVNRRVNRYLKEAWPELDCSLNPCDKNGKRIKNKQRKGREEEKDDEEEVKPELSLSEELKGYKVYLPKTKEEEDDEIEDLANEELVEEDPDHFYYLMKESYKKQQEKQYRPPDPVSRSTMPYQHNNPYPPARMPSRFVLPLFIRYKVPYPMNHYNGAAGPPPSTSYPHNQYLKRQLPPPASRPRRPSIFDNLFRLSKSILSSSSNNPSIRS